MLVCDKHDSVIFGGSRICDQRVFHRPIKKSVIMSCTWNVIDSTNETCEFEFLMDPDSLVNLETEFRSKSRSQVLKGYLGAVDSMHFPMMNPGNKIDNPQ